MPTEKRFFLTMTVIVKDEGPYLAEWIEYHLLQGVEHVYVYDNGSNDRPWELLADYLTQGRATLIHWPEHPGQLSAYNHAIRIFGRDSEWMAVIDVDEFIQPPANCNIPDVLRALEPDVDQLLLPWVHFGSSGHETKPEGLVIENFVHRSAEPHTQTKFVVRPEATRFVGVHHCQTRAGRTVDSAGQPAFERWIQPQPIAATMRINHYFTKSRAEFATKIARGQSDGGSGKSLADFDRFETPVHDDSLAAMGTRVRQALTVTAARRGRLSVHAPWSAQSELTPSDVWQKTTSRLWTTARKALLAEDGHLDIGPSHAALNGVACTAELAKQTVEELCRGITVTPIADLTRWGIPFERSLECPYALGRPFIIWHGQSAQNTTLIIVVDGTDAGGKPWRAERRLAIDPGGSFAALVLSERTMIVEQIEIEQAEPAAIECQFAAIFSFV
ncbi:glycosyltransferase family 92 protein [Rhizorhabdus argentea]|uniref:glycosyltransferase family 92 protein n=1 Tax=Rhizorhabdus argentea TaxID=1387174 RepID=UPI0030EE97C8